MKKRIFLIIAVLMLVMPAFAQKGKHKSNIQAPAVDIHISPITVHPDYEVQWDYIDTLICQRLFTTAYQRADSLFVLAKQEHLSRQILTAAWYMGSISIYYQENAQDSCLKHYHSILPLLEPIDRALCNAQIAKQYFQLYINRPHDNAESNETSLDYRLWPASRFRHTILQYSLNALEKDSLLKHTQPSSFTRFITHGYINSTDYECETDDTQSTSLTPTLYDVLMREAITNCIDSVDEQLRLQQMLIDFHHNDTNVCLQIGLALQQQDLLNTKGRTPQATIYAYQSLINQYRHSHSSCLAEFYYRIATLLDTQYIKAVAYCDTVLTLYPDTYGAAQCSRLKYDITSKSLNIYMPKGVYPSNHNILAVTTCRNIDTLYYRIIPNYKEFPDYYDKKQLARHIRKLPSIKEWYQVVPHRDDYNYQKVFCYIPSLPVGKYSLIASDSPNIKDTFEVLYQKSLIICDALMISINQTDIRKEQSSYGYLMNRISGKPIPGQKVALRTQEKSTTDISHTTTDQNGFFALHTNNLDLSWFTYCLYQGQHIRIFNEEYSNSNDTTDKCITIFADRPIYRPGDTLQFSGITYQSDGHYYAEVIANQKMPIRLISYNRSIIDSLTLFGDSMAVLLYRPTVSREIIL